jgi:hypothetical protein
MSTYAIPSRESDEVCVELGKRRRATAVGTVASSSGPTVSVTSDEANIIFIQIRCMMSSRPIP